MFVQTIEKETVWMGEAESFRDIVEALSGVVPFDRIAWREAVVKDRDRLHAAIEDPGFVRTYGRVYAETSLKRAPTGFDPADPDIELLKLKDVIFGHPLTDTEVLDPALPKRIASDLAAAVPLMRYLAVLPGLEDGPPGWLR